MAKKRTTAQRRAAAKEAWARRKAEAAMAAIDVPPPLARVATSAPVPVTFSATREGSDLFLGVANNGSLHRVKASPEALRTLALDILRRVG